MTTVIELVDELGKVRLAPLVLPALKMLDPVLCALPEGALEDMVSGRAARDNLVRTLEGASPVLPRIIRLAGRMAESKLATGLLALTAVLLTPFMKLAAPVLARLIVPCSGPGLKLASMSGRMLPLTVGLLDVMVTVELALETPHIEHNIAFTREAFNLNKVEELPFPAEDAPTLEDLEENAATINNIRLWDHRPLKDLYNQIQAIPARSTRKMYTACLQ